MEATFKSEMPTFKNRGEQLKWFLRETAHLALAVAENAKIKGIPARDSLDGLFDSLPPEVLGAMVKPYVVSGEAYIAKEDMVGVAKAVAIMSQAENVEEMLQQISIFTQTMASNETIKHRFFWLVKSVGKLVKV